MAKGSKFVVTLDQTLLYPEGGGQPSDTGRIGNAKVLYVNKNSEGEVYHYVDSKVEVGSEVAVTLDWDRRWDNTQQHSGQHLISALCEHAEIFPEFGKTDSWEFGNESCSVDIGPCNLDLIPQGETLESRVKALEKACNQAIREHRTVFNRQMKRSELEDENGNRDPMLRSALPKKVKGDVFRIVEIDGIEKNACGGTHVENLSELQCVKIIGHSLKASTQIVTFTFLIGQRVLDRLEECSNREAAMVNDLSCKREKLPELVQQRLQQLTVANRQVKALTDELVQFLASDLLEKASGRPVVGAFRDCESPFLHLLEKALSEKIKEMEGAPKAILLCCPTAFLLSDCQEGYPLLANKEMLSSLLEEFGAKGAGGKKPVWQGKSMTGIKERNFKKAVGIIEEAVAA
ncbi:alanyl-tRNA synthetase, putative [Perkinsus marinus ATCC 50983]|uniref:Alanyl-tRNA synthetase, putative n=1 Tax=Perkinsus marinus (strain ATCC 50983 / TXsc) TaxID=423536 RepID=C5LVB0_PERM5|nr:alanyl-tRNA synthetase, putative [Perkinsus marinus ATCC 50983]EEQ99348.1 alanyl-tRNA synthetase, putative [Perkinsus marinus ATCC 50983]|eukprot:XP_002766631.1 alanyl-tRNA synthetase, putative [Perkinsus marinus ATCC 50983]